MPFSRFVSSVVSVMGSVAASLSFVTHVHAQGEPFDESGALPVRDVPAPKYYFNPPPARVAGGTAGGPNAGDAQALDMLAAVDTAVAWHPSIQGAIDKLAESGEGIEAARGGYYPQIRGGVNNEMNSTEIDRYGTKRLHRLTVSVSQMLYDFGKVSSKVDQAKAANLIARARVLLAVDDVARNTAQSLIEVLRYQDLLAIARAQVEGVNAIAALAQRRRALGASTLSDEVQARSRGDAAVASRLEIEAQLHRWRTDLDRFLGRGGAYTVSGQLPEVLGAACETPPRNWMSVPSIMVAEAEHAEAKAALEGAMAQSLPTISLEGDANRVLNYAGRGPRQEAAVMLNVSVPMYQGGTLQANRRAAGHMLQAASSNRANAIFNADRSLQDAVSRSVGYRQRIGALEQRVRSMKLTRELYEQQYLNLGSRSLLDLLNAEQEMHQASMERVNNLYDLYRLQVDCLYHTGNIREAFDLGGKRIAGVEILP